MTKQEVIDLIEKLDIQENTSRDLISRRIKNEGLREIVTITNGCSKNCLIFRNEDFVIKWCAYGREEAQKEISLYNLAKEKEIECFFPATELFATVNGIVFVKQEKIDACCDDLQSDKEKTYSRIGRTVSDKVFLKMSKEMRTAHPHYGRIPNSLWVHMAISLYGKCRCKKFCEFLHTHKINDLHSGNLGYKNNKPIVLDFCGFENYSS